jgi:hypothetical protein
MRWLMTRCRGVEAMTQKLGKTADRSPAFAEFLNLILLLGLIL